MAFPTAHSTTNSWRPEAPQVQEQDLAGKVAVVTGASKGIGRSIALNIALRGASVIGTCSGPKTLHLFDTLAHTVTSLYNNSAHSSRAPKVFGIVGDILSPTCPSEIVSAIDKHFGGKLDILVNNAAVMEVKAVGEIEVDHVQRMLMGNIQTPVMLIEDLIRRNMFRSDSRIVNISSETGRLPRARGSTYNATKSALEALTRSWAHELGGRPFMVGTTVNAVIAGLTDSDAFKVFPPDLQKKLGDEYAQNVCVGHRIGYPEDVADLVGLLVSEKARWITGSCVSATGGFTKVL